MSVTGKQKRMGVLRAPNVTVARLVLDSYVRSGWVWGEFVLVLVFFAALFFPFRENTTYFNGTSSFSLGAIAILGSAIMVRQSSSARTYLLLARLTSRATYSQGLMLAAVGLRIPLYVFYLLLVLLTNRLTDPSAGMLFWGGVGILANTMLASVLTVTLCPPIATRLQRIYFLLCLTIVLFSFEPPFALSSQIKNALSIMQLPLWPVEVIYRSGQNGSIDLNSGSGLAIIGIYIMLLVLIAGHWLEKRELLLY